MRSSVTANLVAIVIHRLRLTLCDVTICGVTNQSCDGVEGAFQAGCIKVQRAPLSGYWKLNV